MIAVLNTASICSWAEQLGQTPWPLLPVANRPLLDYWLETCAELGVQSIHMNNARRGALEEVTRAYEGPSLDVYLDWGTYDAWNPQENWDHRPRNRDVTELLRSLGHTVTGGEVHDGTGWSSWKNRTDRVLRALFGN